MVYQVLGSRVKARVKARVGRAVWVRADWGGRAREYVLAAMISCCARTGIRKTHDSSYLR